MLNTLSRHYATAIQLAKLPVAHLQFERHIAPENVAATYTLYTKPHPRYRVIQYKSWGAALIDLHDCGTRDGYFERIKAKNFGAWHAKRARARGYVLAEIDRNAHVDAIHAINTSVEQRQGRPMDDKYLEKQQQFDCLDNFSYFGVFNAEGKLMSYATVGWYGNFSAFSQLMGYRNNDGIMHLMVAEIIGRLIDEGKVRYVMYDTFFGALPGLRQFKTVLNRIYSDYLMPSRLPEYAGLLQEARDAGYAQLSVRDFLRVPAGAARRPTIVHRHDIDSDTRTAAKMFALETRLGVTSSFYFRLSTLDYGLMREIEAYGSEASYHFEEVADYAKRHHLKDAGEVRRRFPAIRAEFLANLERIEGALALKLRTVASHGDFANRRLRVINHEILEDRDFRARCGIACETYDPDLLAQFDLYISDRPPPVFHHPLAPRAALGKYRCICFLTHPVQWETNWRETTRCNVRRLVEGIAW